MVTVEVLSKQLIYKSNALIEASYRLSVPEQRILLACIQQIKKNEEITDSKLYSVTAQDLATLSGVSVSNMYRDLADAATKLMRREVWVTTEPNANGGVKVERFRRWVQSCDYYKEEGRVELRFSKDVLPYLNNLTKEFTRYAISDIAKMDSSHGIRLYELLVQYRSLGERLIEVDELRHYLQLGKTYPDIRDLKKRVVDVSVLQINTVSPLRVEYTQIKRGRKIHAFLFKINSKGIKQVEAATGTPEAAPAPEAVTATPEAAPAPEAANVISDGFTKPADLLQSMLDRVANRSVSSSNETTQEPQVEAQHKEIKLSHSQVNMFAKVLTGDAYFGSNFAMAGETQFDFLERIRKVLANPKQVGKFTAHFKRLGLKIKD